jgi:hypothetical protein
VQAFHGSIPAILSLAGKYERASVKAARLRPALDKLCADLLAAVADRTAEAENLTRMATLMATRLDKERPAPRRSLAQRVRAARAALLG